MPKTSGVYCFKNARGVLYIGKAASLKARVKNHLSTPTWHDNHFVDQATHIGYIETESEIDALLLESQLIKKYQPRYNIMLRDDKQYFYVGFSKDTLPILRITHQPNTSPPRPLSLPRRGGDRGGEVAIGPFTDGGALKTVLRYLRKAFPYYTQPHRKLPCTYCHIDLCPGPTPNIQEYRKNIAKIKAVLNGKKPRVITSLKKGMAQFAKNLKFEKAAKVRGQIQALENVFSHKNLGFRIEGFIPLGTLEAYDISNIQGKEPVASMVRFSAQGGPASGWDWKPNKSMYRKFKIRLPEKPNDVAMIGEVIRRRLAHPEWPYPRIFLIDGGRGQLNAALAEMQNIKYKIRVMALAKKHNELYLPNREKPIRLDTLPKDVKNLFMYARDEAHRFAISYHRKLHRGKTIPLSPPKGAK